MSRASVRFRPTFILVALALLVFGVVGPTLAVDEGADFVRMRARTAAASEAAVDAFLIDVDVQPLMQARTTLAIDLLDGSRHLIRGYQIEERGPGDLAWRGRFEDGGQAVLTLKNGFVVGVLFTPDGTYEITTTPAGQVLQKLDHSRFAPCAHEDRHDESRHELFGEPLGAPPVPGPVGATPEMTVVIDVMSVYTAAARNGAGGTAQIQAVAQSSIDVSNTAFTNSQTTAQFTLVHTAEVSYSETGNIQTDRNWLQANSTVNNLRDVHNADLVGMLVENGGGFCGIAFLMGNEDPAAFAPFGYQVTARNCAVGNLSYPHEHGHNLGLQHNPQNGAPSSQATYVWSYGHYVNGNYRTVMSYSNPCGSGCTRQPYFSNPDVVFQGAATGIANQRDNSRTIDLIAPFTADYRGGGTPPVPGNCNGTNCIDWDVTATVSYSNQDISSNVQVQDGGDTLYLEDNTWRRTTQTFNVTANTVIEFDFRSTSQGEIHGIGFDENDTLTDAVRIFQLHGTQNWGSANHDFDNYTSGTITYTIPVGQYYTGSSMFLVTVNDNDAGSNNTSYFTNVRVYEDGGGTGGCTVDDDFESGAAGWTTGGDCSTGTFILGAPSLQTNSGVTTQVGGDHSSPGTNALYTASNTSAGSNDVDGGTCILESPTYSVSEASDLSVWYFHGQRDTGDDSNDFFFLEVSTNGGSSYSPVVSIGDVQTNAAWTNASTTIPAGSSVKVRVRVADGAGPGDLVEGGIDDLSICPQ